MRRSTRLNSLASSRLLFNLFTRFHWSSHGSSTPVQLQDRRVAQRVCRRGTDIKVETITETTFQTGKELWDWLEGINPIVETVLELNLTSDERRDPTGVGEARP